MLQVKSHTSASGHTVISALLKFSEQVSPVCHATHATSRRSVVVVTSLLGDVRVWCISYGKHNRSPPPKKLQQLWHSLSMDLPDKGLPAIRSRAIRVNRANCSADVIYMVSVCNRGPECRSRYRNSLRAGQSRDRIPLGAKCSVRSRLPIQFPLQWASCLFPGGKRVGTWC